MPRHEYKDTFAATRYTGSLILNLVDVKNGKLNLRYRYSSTDVRLYNCTDVRLYNCTVPSYVPVPVPVYR